MSKEIEERITELDAEEKRIRKQKNHYVVMLYKQRQIGAKISENEYNIMQEICDKYRVTVLEVQSGCREKPLIDAKREIAIYFKSKGYTLQRIAFMIGLTQHASVINLIKKNDKNRRT